MKGDTLAAGGKSATFGPPKVTQAKWDEAFANPASIKSSAGLDLEGEMPAPIAPKLGSHKRPRSKKSRRR